MIGHGWKFHWWRQTGYDVWNLSVYKEVSDTKILVQKPTEITDEGYIVFEQVELDRHKQEMPYVFYVIGPTIEGLRDLAESIAKVFNIYTEVTTPLKVEIDFLNKQAEFLKSVITTMAKGGN